MLPKLYRLRKERDFKILVQQGKSFFLKELGLKYLKNNLDYSRFGFVVSTKIDKRATVRNKIKRRLREIIYQNLKKIKLGFDILILTRPEIKKLDFRQIKEILEKIFIKLDLFQNHKLRALNNCETLSA